ncbi:hypothetical protein N9242_01585 [Vicingaceae bacterium]|nr:hypothetical protein [Vicingaceae bacterium]
MTFFWKFIFPTIGIIVFGSGVIATLSAGIYVGFIMSLIFILAVLFMYLTTIRAKKVSIDNEFLYINNFRKTIKTPLSNIKKVDDIVFVSPRTIIIHFKEPTEFGKKISFLGYTEIMLFYGEHPAVKDIRNKTNFISSNIE